ncbi:hypothetical protein KKF34_16345 [Myxococcota bacterium]|nr:hypothetical protein [Myxococcota bacterium]MBU1382320.1 hypothetical protein [Myxococcota bacterium]MBU1498448.1 hypothetical protein [Myxococcota bacterium]
MKTAIFSLILVLSVFSSGPVTAKHGISAKTINQVTKDLGEKPDILITINMRNIKSSYFYSKLLPLATQQAQKEKEMCFDKINMKSIDYALITGRVKKPNVKEAVAVVVSGSFNSVAFLDCVAKRNKLVTFRKDGVSGYREKKGQNYAFAVGPGSILMIQGDYINKIKLKKGSLGTGSISSMVSRHAVSAKVDRMEKGSEIKSLSGRVEIKNDIKAIGNCTWKSLKERNDFDKKMKEFQKSPFVSTFMTGLKYTFSGTKMDLSYLLTKQQFDALFFLSKSLINKPKK